MEDEYDPNDGREEVFLFFSCFVNRFFYLVNNRPRIIDDRLKQLQPHQNKSSKPNTKAGNDDLKKLIQERRKAAAAHSTTATNQNHDVEIFVTQK